MRRLLGTVVACLTGLIGPAPVAASALPVGSAVRVAPGLPARADSELDRTISDPRITESSGLAASLRHPGVLWTHNDSGHPAQLFAIGRNGSTVATLTLRGEPARDWEAIAVLRDPAGRPMLAVGDIGDNQAERGSVRVALIPEPARLSDATVTPTRVLQLRYPGGPRDAEALLADPRTGRLYILSKALVGTQLFAVPETAWPGRTTGTSRADLTAAAAVSPGVITDGVFLPDGSRILLRGYGQLHLLDGPTAITDGRLRTLASVALPLQAQGESLTVGIPERGSGGAAPYALIGSEGRSEPVLRVPIPQVDAATPATAATTRAEPGGAGATPPAGGTAASGAGSGEPTGSSSGSDEDADGGSGSLPWLAGGAVGTALLLGAGVAVTRRRR
jgi:hypothetical protein